ncbi:MAG: histidine phosphatase family protein [Sulfitobacter sp. SK025]|nr:MAG: histidine phosphatase family protein [Sulfitobacter sp. SK025]
MKRLILMRHAKSDWSSAGTSDHDRVLNERGRQNAVSLGHWLAQRSLIPDAALCSTATRARQTLDLLDLPPYTSVTFHRNLYLASAETLLTALRAAKGDTILIVAHNPGIGVLASAILTPAAGSSDLCHYPTGATMVATFNISTWETVALGLGQMTEFIVPRELPQYE